LLTDTAEQMQRWRVAPGGLMIGAIIACLASIGCIAFYRPIAALGFMILNRLLSALAASVARLTGCQKRQNYLEDVNDMSFFGGVTFGFALAEPGRALAAGFLILGFVLAATTRRRASVGSDARSCNSHLHSISFGDALAENGLTFVVLVLACVIASSFSIAAYIAGVLLFGLAGARVANTLEKLE
jgi:hypothetical protein